MNIYSCFSVISNIYKYNYVEYFIYLLCVCGYKITSVFKTLKAGYKERKSVNGNNISKEELVV